MWFLYLNSRIRWSFGFRFEEFFSHTTRSDWSDRYTKRVGGGHGTLVKLHLGLEFILHSRCSCSNARTFGSFDTYIKPRCLWSFSFILQSSNKRSRFNGLVQQFVFFFFSFFLFLLHPVRDRSLIRANIIPIF